MSEQHFDPDAWVPKWLERCAEIGADPLLRDSQDWTASNRIALFPDEWDDLRDNIKTPEGVFDADL
jgi:hypothetical protein